MAIRFTRAIEVTSGERPTSRHMRSLARAWNDRDLSGIGDTVWRRAMYIFNLFRLMRNPSGQLFPPLGEFFEGPYQSLDPEHSTGLTYPTAPAGEDEGANLANPMMQFVFGAGDLPSEDVRLEAACPLYIWGGPPGTLLAHWQLAKAQRGAFCPDTLGQNWPAGEAAQTLFKVGAPWYSPHLKSYGAFFPRPEFAENLGAPLTDCGAGVDTDIGYMVPSFLYKFTALRPDVPTAGLHGAVTTGTGGTPVVTYPGSCPCGSALHDSDHVAWISRGPFTYRVYGAPAPGDCNYWVDHLPVADWIEGPYEGEGYLQHAEGGQLKRAVWAFLTDFRGTPEQRRGHATTGRAGIESPQPDAFKIRDIAFDNELFGLSQYPLAPALAAQVGEDLIPLYPTARITASQQAGYAPPFADGRATHEISAGFVACGFFARADGLQATCQIQVLADDAVVALLDLVPDADGAAQALKYVCEDPALGTIAFRLATAAVLDSGGEIQIEAAEVVAYRPHWWDAYLVARMMATSGGDPMQGGVDGRGLDQSDSSAFVRSLLQYGSLHNTRGAAGPRGVLEWVNDNPAYDAARRLSRDLMRIWQRRQFVSYEVAGGKSILRFRRFACGMHQVRADLFHGIAPPIDPVPSGELIEGETYVVRSATGGLVDYNGARYANDQVLTASALATFQAVGDAVVYVHDGIRHSALKRGWTNRWCIFLQTKVYHPSASSIWKPEAYADFYTWSERCMFYGGWMPSGQVRAHVAYQFPVGLDDDYRPYLLPPSVQSTLIAPEAPTGYRTVKSTNISSYTLPDGFCASCTLYQAPYEIESCVVEDWGTDQIVKLTLTRRLDSHPDAPVTVDPDPLTWSADEVAILRNEYLTDPAVNEHYRTDDNAVREYALHVVDASKNCSWKVGDAGAQSSVQNLSDNPYGCCYPHFFAVRLMPEPYEDDNDREDPHDARRTIDALLQAEISTVAGCEGYVDGRTSAQLACDQGGGLYEYRFETLCFDAFSGRWMSAFGMADRPDGPEGFGPLPNTAWRRDVFNRLATAVNLLDKARVELPFELEFRHSFHAGQRDEAVVVTYGPSECTTGSPTGFYLDHVTPCAVTFDSYGAWDVTTVGFAVGDNQRLSEDCPFGLERLQTRAEFRPVPTTAAVAFLRPELQELVEAGNTGILARLTFTATADRREAGTGDLCDGLTMWGGNTWVDASPAVPAPQCMVISSGELVPQTIRSGDLKMSWVPAGGPAYCFNQLATATDLALISDWGFFLHVPLVDMP
jgi:hypothetical protein